PCKRKKYWVRQLRTCSAPVFQAAIRTSISTTKTANPFTFRWDVSKNRLNALGRTGEGSAGVEKKILHRSSRLPQSHVESLYVNSRCWPGGEERTDRDPWCGSARCSDPDCAGAVAWCPATPQGRSMRPV